MNAALAAVGRKGSRRVAGKEQLTLRLRLGGYILAVMSVG